MIPAPLAFVRANLPRPPARVLEIGAGDGALAAALRDAGYDVVAIDPNPGGADVHAVALLELEEAPASFQAAVAITSLHHVEPLEESLDLLATLAPLLLVDEFAWNRIDDAARDWYEGRYRLLRAAGAEPGGPASLEEWRWRHPGLHPDDAVLGALRERYEEVVYERLPYLFRWLEGPHGDGGSEALEQSLVDAGALPAIGYRWAGASTSTTRSSADAR